MSSSSGSSNSKNSQSRRLQAYFQDQWQDFHPSTEAAAVTCTQPKTTGAAATTRTTTKTTEKEKVTR